MTDLACVVTGATSGIGRATAFELARRGATVGIVARNQERGVATLEAISAATGNKNVHLFLADLSLQREVRAVCDDVAQRFERLSVLVNDAAVFVTKRTETAEGLELMFATNQVAPFLLTLRLLPVLRAAGLSRVINVTAPSTVKPEFGDLQSRNRFRPTKAFGASKAANLLFTFATARRLAGSGVTVNAFHPGLVRTGLMRNTTLPVRALTRVMYTLRAKTPEEAGGELAELATASAFRETSGRLIHNGKPIRSPFEGDLEAQEQLFRACEELTGEYLPG